MRQAPSFVRTVVSLTLLWWVAPACQPTASLGEACSGKVHCTTGLHCLDGRCVDSLTPDPSRDGGRDAAAATDAAASGQDTGSVGAESAAPDATNGDGAAADAAGSAADGPALDADRTDRQGVDGATPDSAAAEGIVADSWQDADHAVSDAAGPPDQGPADLTQASDRALADNASPADSAAAEAAGGGSDATSARDVGADVGSPVDATLPDAADAAPVEDAWDPGWCVDGVVQDLDQDGHDCTVDCDDDDALLHPGAAEVCDGVDNDCDALVDGDDPDFAGSVQSYYVDCDRDSYGANNTTVVAACAPPASAPASCSGGQWATRGGDCADNNQYVSPGQSYYSSQPYNGSNWDWNCNGRVEQRWSTSHGTCTGTSPNCQVSGARNYYTGTVAACGQGAPGKTCFGYGSGYPCAWSNATVYQECR